MTLDLRYCEEVKLNCTTWLGKLTTLNDFRLGACYGVTNLGAICLGSLVSLMYLELSGCCITSNGASYLGKLGTYRHLDFGGLR